MCFSLSRTQKTFTRATHPPTHTFNFTTKTVIKAVNTHFKNKQNIDWMCYLVEPESTEHFPPPKKKQKTRECIRENPIKKK